MMEQMIRIDGHLVARTRLNDDAWQTSLEALYTARKRAICMCSKTAPELYVAKRNGLFFLARIPGSGRHHHPACPSFDLDEGDPESTDGRTVLTPGFSLENAVSDSAKQTSAALTPMTPHRESTPVSTLADIVHVLWRRAEFNRWTPRMAGKRNWGVLKRYLADAATHLAIGNRHLEDILFMPPPFDRHMASQLNADNHAKLQALCQSDSGKPRKCLAFGSVKSMRESRYGYQLQIRHLPDIPIYCRPATINTLKSRYPFELDALSTQTSEHHVFAMMLLERSSQGHFLAVDLALFRTNKDYVPVASTFEEALIDCLIQNGRAFLRPLIPSAGEELRAVAYLTDAGPAAVPLYISHSTSDNTHRWVWLPAVHRDVCTRPLPAIVPHEEKT